MEIKEKTMEDQKVAIMNYKGALKDMDVLVSKLTGEIRIVTLIEHKVLSGIHNGSLDNIQESYNIMAEYSIENKYDIIGSPKEIYIKNKYEVDNEEDLVTEIQLPVIKMG